MDVLLIGYHFPPTGGVGAIRIAKTAKFLPDSWNVHVLVTRRSDTETGVEDESGAVIHEMEKPLPDAPDIEELRLASTVATTVRRLHDRIRFDCIWHTAGPFLPLAACPAVRRYYDVPYVVDLRDPWTLHPTAEERTTWGKVNDALSAWLEPRVVRAADAVTTATPTLTRDYREQYPAHRGKFATVHNGYDPADFASTADRDPDHFVVVYAGKFTDRMDPEPFLDAVGRLGTETECDPVLRHAGRADDRVVRLARKHGVEDAYEHLGYLSRDELSRVVRGADLGLALTRDSEQEIPTKLYDYIACETPVLACGPRGDMRTLASEFEHGYVCANEPDAVYRTLDDIVEDGPTSLGEGPYRAYTRRAATEGLASVLRRVVAD